MPLRCGVGFREEKPGLRLIMTLWNVKADYEDTSPQTLNKLFHSFMKQLAAMFRKTFNPQASKKRLS